GRASTGRTSMGPQAATPLPDREKLKLRNGPLRRAVARALAGPSLKSRPEENIMHLTALIEGLRSRANDLYIIKVTITNDRDETVTSVFRPVDGPDEQASVWWQAKAVITALDRGIPAWAWPKGTTGELVRFVQDRVYEAHANAERPVYRLSIDL